jgi:hypothetical protein
MSTYSNRTSLAASRASRGRGSNAQNEATAKGRKYAEMRDLRASSRCAKRSHRDVRSCPCPEMSAFVRLETEMQNEATAIIKNRSRDPGPRRTSEPGVQGLQRKRAQNEANQGSNPLFPS